MITLYGYSRTRSTRIAWALEELGISYAYQSIVFNRGDHRSDNFLAVNPGGKVPAIHDDEYNLTLLESGAILRYLATKVPETPLLPSDPKLRALCDQWCYFAQSELEQPLWTMGKSKFALPKPYRLPEYQTTVVYEFGLALQLLSEGLGEQTFILGDTFTLADILLGHVLMWGENFGMEIPQANLQAYKARLQQRPALRAAAKREYQEADKAEAEATS